MTAHDALIVTKHVIGAVTIPFSAIIQNKTLVCTLAASHWPHDDHIHKRTTLEQGEEGYLGRAAVAPSRHAGTPHRCISPSHCWPPRWDSERAFARATDRTRAPRRSYYQAVCPLFCHVPGPDLEETQTFARSRMDNWTGIRYVADVLPF